MTPPKRQIADESQLSDQLYNALYMLVMHAAGEQRDKQEIANAFGNDFWASKLADVIVDVAVPALFAYERARLD